MALPVDTLTTLHDGSFGRGSLKAGVYTLSAAGRGGTSARRTLDLRPGDIATVDLRIP